MHHHLRDLRRSLVIHVARCGLALALFPPVQGQTTFQGVGGSTDWTSPVNWSGGVPNSSSPTVLDNDLVIVGFGTHSTGAFQLFGGSNLQIGGSGRLESGHVDLATGIGQVATVHLSGAGASWAVSGNLDIGGHSHGTGAINFNSGHGTLTVSNGAQLSVTGNLYLAESHGSTGTLNIGDYDLSNATTAGVLTVGSLTLGSSSGAATINFNQTDTFVFNQLVEPTGSVPALNLRGTGTTILANHHEYFTPNITVTDGWLQLDGDFRLSHYITQLTMNGGGIKYGAAFDNLRAFTLGAGGVKFDTNGFSVTYAPAITGAGGLTKQGEGTLILAGANTYAGSTTISTGTLVLNGTTASSGFAIAGGATLELNVSGNPAYAGNPVFTGAGTLRKTGAGTAGWSATTAAFALEAGGLIDVQSGTLVGGSGGDEDWSNNRADLNVAAGAHFQGVEADVRVDALTGGGTIVTGYFGWGSITVGVADGSGTFSGVVADFVDPYYGHAGGGRLIKVGTGTQTLTGNNTFTAGLAVNGGTVSVAADANLGAAAGGVSLDGGRLLTTATFAAGRSTTLHAGGGTFDQAGGTVLTWGGEITGGGALTKQGGGTLTLTGANTYTGGTTIVAGQLQIGNGSSAGSIVGDVVNHGVIVFNRAGSLTYAGAISGTGSLIQQGTGTLTLTGNHTYGGGTRLAGGTLAAGSGTALGAGLVYLDGGALQAAGGARTIANDLVLNGDTVISGTQALTLNGALTLARNRDFTVTNTAVTTLAGVIGESGGPRFLAKYGAGELELTGANTYTGGTLIAEGTVRINNSSGSAFGAGAVTVAAGATLTGAGDFGGALQNNGTYAPGNSPSLEALASFSQGPTGLLAMEIAGLARGTGYDALDITGSAHFGGTLEVTFLGGFTAAAGQNFDFFNWGGYDGSQFSAIILPGLEGGLTWDQSLLYTTGVISIAGAAIPEPSIYALLAGAGVFVLGALGRRRRRQESPVSLSL